MEIILRKMNADDADAVMRLSKQLGYAISAVETKENIHLISCNETSEAFVAVHEKDVVGWISVASVYSLTSPLISEIRGLIVDEKYRGNNIGKMLVDKTKEWCALNNCKRLRLRCNTTRKETHNFYLHLGFTEKKEQKVFEIDV